MANPKKRRLENVEGPFYVDSSCIDCGTCYWMEPSAFKEKGGMSAVISQPKDEDKIKRALQALHSCPTSSIGYSEKNTLSKEAANSFPVNIEEDVYHTGFHSKKSYGAASYLVARKRDAILVDSPRHSKFLAKKIEALKTPVFQYLTHKDDVADTDKFQQEFCSQRIIHSWDANAQTSKYEILLEGEEEWRLDEDVVFIPVPGHTKGHTVLLYKNKFLFTGDHLAWSPEMNQLYAFKNACWFDFAVQIKSMKRLLDYNFSHVLPGHGAPLRCDSAQRMRERLIECIQWMERQV